VSGAQDGIVGRCRGFGVGMGWDGIGMLDRIDEAGGPQSLVGGAGYSMSEGEDRLVEFAEQRR
jgi:hypothetical protein